MRMGSRMAFVAGLAMMAYSHAAMAVSLPNLANDPLGLERAPGRKQRRGKGQNNRRGKGIQAKQKKHPNRLTISKRVRRRHRRAAL